MSQLSRRAVAACFGAAALVAGPLVAAPASAEPISVQLVGTNDFHGRLEVTGTTEEDDVPPNAPIGGAEQIAGALTQLRAENPNTVFVSAGDNIGASTFTSNVQQDEPTLQALDAMGLGVSALGNHEFDQGYDDIQNGGRVDTIADFPYLGANVYDADTGEVLFDEYAVQDIGGVQVGFVGVVTGETETLVSPEGIQGIDFGDVTEAANRVSAQLSDGDAANGEADVVVLLAHTGSVTADCATMAEETGEFGVLLNGLTPDTDMIFSGHTHQEYACAAVTGAGGFSGPVVQSGQYGDNLDVIEFTYETTTGEITVVPQDVRLVPIVGLPQDTNPTVTQIVADAVAFAQEAGAVPLGEITEDITRAFSIGEDGEPVEDRGSESVLGNFVADVQLAQTQAAGAQIAFMNPGGLRDDFLVGDTFGSEACGVVTLGEANVVQPFANGVVTMTLTGAQVKEVLEEQWQPETASRSFLALGVSKGFLFGYDSARPQGDRITAITLDGEPIEPGATYRVTVNSFLASGGDNFSTLAEGTERTELGVTDLEALTAYLDTNSPVTADRESRRSADGGAANPPLPSGATCPQAPPPPPPGNGDLDCDDFPTQAAAQAALTPGDPYHLDADNDGVACEDFFDDDEGKAGKKRNRGLRVDTGVESAGESQLLAAAALGGVVGTGVFVALVRRRREVDN